MAHKNFVPHPILSVFESLPGLYLIISPDFYIQAVSDAYLQETFTLREKIMGKYIFDVFPDNPKAPEANAATNLAASFQQVLSSRKAHTMDFLQYDLPDPNSEDSFIERFWSPVNTPVLNQEGEVMYIIHHVSNITEKIKAAQKLQKSKDREQSTMAMFRQQRHRLELFLREAPALTIILDGPDFVTEFVNPAFQQAFPNCQLVGTPLLTCLPELAETNIPAMLQEVYSTGASQESKEILIPTTLLPGEQQVNSYFNIFLQARFDIQCQIDGIMLFAFDVSEQVNSRKTIAENNEHFQFVTNAMPQKVWSAETNGEIDYLNEKWLTYTGLSYKELKKWGWKSTIHPEDWEDNEKAWQHSIEHGQDFQLEHRFRRKDGQYRWHLTRGHAQRSKDANIKAWIGTDTDIHDQKLTEQSLKEVTSELSDTNQQLRSLHKDLDNFIYIASHDLKIPITNIEGLVNLLELKLPPACYQEEPIKSIIGMMQISVERFKKTVSSLTEITRLQKDSHQEPTQQSIAMVVQAVIEDLGQIIKKTGAQLEIDVKDCPFIFFSEKNLRAVIHNLISNAILYHSPERTPKIHISCRSIPGFAILQVKDNGLGIDLKSHEAKLFSMFNRLHTHIEGTGIGLFMVNRIVENAGGKIKVSSTPGEGSAFDIYFRQ